MARPRINPSARSIPISFSVKPDLAAKIDEYSHQIRFSRSKFLAQAVTEAITKIEMGYDAVDYDVRNMTDNQRLASALNVFNQPTPEQEINPKVVELLKNAIALWESSQEVIDTDDDEIPGSSRRRIKIKRIEAGQYNVFDVDADDVVAHIYKDLNRTERPWIFSNHLNGDMLSSRTLADAKDVAYEELGA